MMLDLNGGFYSYKLSTKNSRIVVVSIKSSFDFYIFNKIKYVCTSFTCVVNGLCFLARILLLASLSLVFFSCSSLTSSISPMLALIANLFLLQQSIYLQIYLQFLHCFTIQKVCNIMKFATTLGMFLKGTLDRFSMSLQNFKCLVLHTSWLKTE